MTPTLDGYPIFGPACTVRTLQRPRALAIGFDFGGATIGIQDGGSRGTDHQALGMIWGYTAAGLLAVFSTAAAMKDGKAHTFVDAMGTEWPQTVLVTHEPVGRVIQDGRGNVGRGFRATLLTLSAQF